MRPYQPASLPLFVMPAAGMRSLVGRPCMQQLATRPGGAPRPAHVQAEAAAADAVREVKAAVGRLQPVLEGHEARHGGPHSTCILDLPVEHRRGFFSCKDQARGARPRPERAQLTTCLMLSTWSLCCPVQGESRKP